MRELRVFIIGPMRDKKGDVPRLEKFKNFVVNPLMDEVQNRHPEISSCLVQNPWDLADDHIMDKVIEVIDRADIIFADITDSNPNVMYELGICHSLGKPTIIVREDDPDNKLTPFDISAYRFTPIELNKENYHDAKSLLREILFTAVQRLDNWAITPNPVTNFYGEPLTSISPAAGLARGYFHNFIKPAIERLTSRTPDQDAYLFNLDVRKAGGDWETNGKDIGSRLFMKLIIVVPDHVWLATRSRIDKIRPKLLEARIQSYGRDFTAYALEEEGQVHLVDIPSTINVMESAIRSRMDRFGGSHHRDSDDWRRVESQEISRFIFELNTLIEEGDPDHRDLMHSHLEIRRFYLEQVNPELQLFHEVWRA